MGLVAMRVIPNKEYQMKGPMEWGNFALIFVGIGLVFLGPTIIYRTVTGLRKLRAENPQASLQPFNNGFNILVGVLFFFAGILFVLNNLRGNPLH
jgi:hypothetical protein